MKKLYFTTLLLLIFPIVSFTQIEEDESCLPPKKKVLKTLSKAKKLDAAQASKEFRDAIDMAPDNAMVYYEFAMYAYNRAMQMYNENPDPTVGDNNLKVAEGMFEKVIEYCPNYHSNPYYYLGIINYSFNQQEKAISYFKQFKAFDDKEIDKYADDHTKRLKDIDEVLSEFEEEKSFYENEVPFEPMMVKNVSSPQDEYFPMLSPDNELIFFTRRVDRTAKGDIISTIKEEFTWAKRQNMNTEFDSGTPLDLPFNDETFDSYGAATLSVDNKEMIICACKDERVQGQIYRNCDLYTTSFKRTGEGGNDYMWSELKNMGSGINTPDGWEGQPSLSADGNTLYFTANRPTTRNDDIFYTERLSDGSWRPAKPFTEVNTAGKDKSPFIHQDSETFYFVSSVSKERKGLGGTDIFYMRKDENGNWMKPKNIGYPINTEEDEIGLFVSIDGTKAYYSSRNRGNWDIFSFDLYEDARPQEVVMVKGELEKENEDDSFEDIEIEVSYSNSDKVETSRVNGDDGKYAVVVKADSESDAMINLKKEGYAFDSKLIGKEELIKGITITDKNMEVKKVKVGEPYTLNDILYKTASAELSNQDQFVLKQFSRFLKENPHFSITIQGHTDNVGNPQNNLELSEKRAQGVKQFLIETGIDAHRLKAKGYGQSKPKVANDSEKNRSINRRTDFVIEEL